MNKVILMGRLTRDPEVRYSNQGDRQMAIARYTLAVERRRRSNDNNEQTADFINCVVFDRQAEFVEKYLRKGTRMVVTGRLQTGSYTNKDGVKVYTTDVIVEEQEFAESSRAASGNSGNDQNGFNGGQNNGFNGNQNGFNGGQNNGFNGNQNGFNGGQNNGFNGNQNGFNGGQNNGFNGNQNGFSGGQNNGFSGNQNGFSGGQNDGFMNIPDGVDDESLPFN